MELSYDKPATTAPSANVAPSLTPRVTTHLLLPAGVGALGLAALVAMPGQIDELDGWAVPLLSMLGMLMAFAVVEWATRFSHTSAKLIAILLAIVFGAVATGAADHQTKQLGLISQGWPIQGCLAALFFGTAFWRYRLPALTAALSISLGNIAMELLAAASTWNPAEMQTVLKHFTIVFAALNLMGAVLLHLKGRLAPGHVGALCVVAVIFSQGWVLVMVQTQDAPLWGLAGVQLFLLSATLWLRRYGVAISLLIATAVLGLYASQSELLSFPWGWDVILATIGTVIVGGCGADYWRRRRTTAKSPA